MKLVGALDVAGIELIGEGALSSAAAAASGSNLERVPEPIPKEPRRTSIPARRNLSAMAAIAGLCCVGVLLGIAVLVILPGPARASTVALYTACLAVSLAALLLALHHLLFGAAADVTLPLGLPWVGAHFRVDALGLFPRGRQHRGRECAPPRTRASRMLPFFPAFLAGMNLVLLAADAFSFLVAWEFMSLASWALVRKETRRLATSISSWRALARWFSCSHSAFWPAPKEAMRSMQSARTISCRSARGWVGTTALQAEIIVPLIQEMMQSGRAVALAIKSRPRRKPAAPGVQGQDGGIDHRADRQARGPARG
jgi:uncharacterized membrane protein YccF (DUF307 family)